MTSKSAIASERMYLKIDNLKSFMQISFYGSVNLEMEITFLSPLHIKANMRSRFQVPTLVNKINFEKQINSLSSSLSIKSITSSVIARFSGNDLFRLFLTRIYWKSSAKT